MRVKRGEIWLAEMDPTRGLEQAGTRPVLILQKVKADLNMIPSFCAINSGCWIKLAYQRKLGTVSQQTLSAVESCILFTLGIRQTEGNLHPPPGELPTKQPKP
jgi:mRNA-degrading endonuclease toxin of MazEF toxin-antitoxin module